MSTDQIQQRAYEIYLERQAQGIDGTEESDWEAAERELSPGQAVEEGDV